MEGLKTTESVSGANPLCGGMILIIADIEMFSVDDLPIPIKRYWITWNAWKVLNAMDSYKTEEGNKIENKCKNRNPYKLPFDHTRVVLRHKHPIAEPGGEYINANYISLDTSILCVKVPPFTAFSDSTKDDGPKEKLYIAAQGCLPDTEDDFYHMIWQDNVTVIVMLTKQIEVTKIKCCTYWPKQGEIKLLQCFSLELVSETVYSDYITREIDIINLSADSQRRTIVQYQYTAWPDGYVPVDVRMLLKFIFDINQDLKNRAESTHDHILCVHCSAGMGRTGVFIALHFILHQIKTKGGQFKLDVLDVVKEMRKQRPGMVQTRVQYTFLYTALQEFLQYQQAPNGDD